MIKHLHKLIHPIQGNIWCLHRVMPNKSTFKENRELEVTPEFFESLIVQSQSAGYKFASIDEITTKLHVYRYPWQSKFIHVTFDDGFEDIYQHAFPILKKHQIPFTIYLSTDIIDRKTILWWLVLEKIVQTNNAIQLTDNTTYFCHTEAMKQETFTRLSHLIFTHSETPTKAFEHLFSNYQSYFETGQNNILTESQIKEMLHSGLCTLGAHAVSHPILTKLNTEQCMDEIHKSKAILESRFGVPVNHFSYPYSFWNEEIQKLIKQAGYHTAVLGYGGNCRYKMVDLLKIPRTNIIESNLR
ncbi:MAG: polysaccharide deacetylase family protein [Microbacter sp.]